MPESTDIMEREREQKPRNRISPEGGKKQFPQHLRPFVPWRGEPESEELPLVESAFDKKGNILPEFTRLLAMKESIAQENIRRAEQGLLPVNIIGIHASANEHVLSRELLKQLLVTPERLGMEIKTLSVNGRNGQISPQKIRNITEALKNADGFIITTHTEEGELNDHYVLLRKALKEADLKGKFFAFAHTFDKRGRDSEVAPLYAVNRFFANRGCINTPYPYIYMHTEGLNENWATREVERVGTNFIRLLERFSRSQLKELVLNPEVAETRTYGGELTAVWKSLRRKVEKINREREAIGEGPLTALFIASGENPEGFSATVARELALNFEYLGVRAQWLYLARTNMAFTTGDPNVTLSEEIPSEDWPIIKGSIEEAYLKVLNADIVIADLQVRGLEAAARLQQFIERSFALEEGFLLEGKAFGTIITFGEAGAVDTQSRLERIAQDNGMMVIPYGGINVHLTSDPQRAGVRGKRKERDFNYQAVLEKEGRRGKLRQMGVLGTALTVDILLTDGAQLSKIRWDHLNPLLGDED